MALIGATARGVECPHVEGSRLSMPRVGAELCEAGVVEPSPAMSVAPSRATTLLAPERGCVLRVERGAYYVECASRGLRARHRVRLGRRGLAAIKSGAPLRVGTTRWAVRVAVEWVAACAWPAPVLRVAALPRVEPAECVASSVAIASGPASSRARPAIVASRRATRFGKCLDVLSSNAVKVGIYADVR